MGGIITITLSSNPAINNGTRNNEKSNFRGIENLEGRTIRHCAHAPLVFWTIDEGKTARMGAALLTEGAPKMLNKLIPSERAFGNLRD